SSTTSSLLGSCQENLVWDEDYLSFNNIIMDNHYLCYSSFSSFSPPKDPVYFVSNSDISSSSSSYNTIWMIECVSPIIREHGGWRIEEILSLSPFYFPIVLCHIILDYYI